MATPPQLSVPVGPGSNRARLRRGSIALMEDSPRSPRRSTGDGSPVRSRMAPGTPQAQPHVQFHSGGGNHDQDHGPDEEHGNDTSEGHDSHLDPMLGTHVSHSLESREPTATGTLVTDDDDDDDDDDDMADSSEGDDGVLNFARPSDGLFPTFDDDTLRGDTFDDHQLSVHDTEGIREAMYRRRELIERKRRQQEHKLAKINKRVGNLLMKFEYGDDVVEDVADAVDEDGEVDFRRLSIQDQFFQMYVSKFKVDSLVKNFGKTREERDRVLGLMEDWMQGEHLREVPVAPTYASDDDELGDTLGEGLQELEQTLRERTGKLGEVMTNVAVAYEVGAKAPRDQKKVVQGYREEIKNLQDQLRLNRKETDALKKAHEYTFNELTLTKTEFEEREVQYRATINRLQTAVQLATGREGDLRANVQDARQLANMTAEEAKVRQMALEKELSALKHEQRERLKAKASLLKRHEARQEDTMARRSQSGSTVQLLPSGMSTLSLGMEDSSGPASMELAGLLQPESTDKVGFTATLGVILPVDERVPYLAKSMGAVKAKIAEYKAYVDEEQQKQREAFEKELEEEVRKLNDQLVHEQEVTRAKMSEFELERTSLEGKIREERRKLKKEHQDILREKDGLVNNINSRLNRAEMELRALKADPELEELYERQSEHQRNDELIMEVQAKLTEARKLLLQEQSPANSLAVSRLERDLELRVEQGLRLEEEVMKLMRNPGARALMQAQRDAQSKARQLQEAEAHTEQIKAGYEGLLDKQRKEIAALEEEVESLASGGGKKGKRKGAGRLKRAASTVVALKRMQSLAKLPGAGAAGGKKNPLKKHESSPLIKAGGTTRGSSVNVLPRLDEDHDGHHEHEGDELEEHEEAEEEKPQPVRKLISMTSRVAIGDKMDATAGKIDDYLMKHEEEIECNGELYDVLVGAQDKLQDMSVAMRDMTEELRIQRDTNTQLQVTCSELAIQLAEDIGGSGALTSEALAVLHSTERLHNEELSSEVDDLRYQLVQTKMKLTEVKKEARRLGMKQLLQGEGGPGAASLDRDGEDAGHINGDGDDDGGFGSDDNDGGGGGDRGTDGNASGETTITRLRKALREGRNPLPAVMVDRGTHPRVVTFRSRGTIMLKNLVSTAAQTGDKPPTPPPVLGITHMGSMAELPLPGQPANMSREPSAEALEQVRDKLGPTPTPDEKIGVWMKKSQENLLDQPLQHPFDASSNDNNINSGSSSKKSSSKKPPAKVGRRTSSSKLIKRVPSKSKLTTTTTTGSGTTGAGATVRATKSQQLLRPARTSNRSQPQGDDFDGMVRDLEAKVMMLDSKLTEKDLKAKSLQENLKRAEAEITLLQRMLTEDNPEGAVQYMHTIQAIDAEMPPDGGAADGGPGATSGAVAGAGAGAGAGGAVGSPLQQKVVLEPKVSANDVLPPPAAVEQPLSPAVSGGGTIARMRRRSLAVTPQGDAALMQQLLGAAAAKAAASTDSLATEKTPNASQEILSAAASGVIPRASGGSAAPSVSGSVGTAELAIAEEEEEVPGEQDDNLGHAADESVNALANANGNANGTGNGNGNTKTLAEVMSTVDIMVQAKAMRTLRATVSALRKQKFADKMHRQQLEEELYMMQDKYAQRREQNATLVAKCKRRQRRIEALRDEVDRLRTVLDSRRGGTAYTVPPVEQPEFDVEDTGDAAMAMAMAMQEEDAAAAAAAAEGGEQQPVTSTGTIGTHVDASELAADTAHDLSGGGKDSSENAANVARPPTVPTSRGGKRPPRRKDPFARRLPSVEITTASKQVSLEQSFRTSTASQTDGDPHAETTEPAAHDATSSNKTEDKTKGSRVLSTTSSVPALPPVPSAVELTSEIQSAVLKAKEELHLHIPVRGVPVQQGTRHDGNGGDPALPEEVDVVWNEAENRPSNAIETTQMLLQELQHLRAREASKHQHQQQQQRPQHHQQSSASAAEPAPPGPLMEGPPPRPAAPQRWSSPGPACAPSTRSPPLSTSSSSKSRSSRRRHVRPARRIGRACTSSSNAWKRTKDECALYHTY